MGQVSEERQPVGVAWTGLLAPVAVDHVDLAVGADDEAPGHVGGGGRVDAIGRFAGHPVAASRLQLAATLR